MTRGMPAQDAAGICGIITVHFAGTSAEKISRFIDRPSIDNYFDNCSIVCCLSSKNTKHMLVAAMAKHEDSLFKITLN